MPVLAGGAEGLPARLICGVPFREGCPSLSFMRFFVPSLISPPEPAPSPSLPEPAFERECLVPAPGADEDGSAKLGDIGLEGGCTGCEDERPLCFLCFLRDDSLPLASEMLGEPGRLSEESGLGLGRGCLAGRPEGVFVPREEAPEDILEGLVFSRSEVLAFLASSFLRSSALASSVSVSSDSLYEAC